MTAATTWHGRRGAVLLGPTEHRVARWLAARTTHGRIRIRMVELADALRLERSEAYRVTARLRVLGLFGVENDRGGNKGGRHYWRTAVEHDGAELDPIRHRVAWSRIVAWSRDRRDRVMARLAAIRADYTRRLDRPAQGERAATPAGLLGGRPASTFADAMRRHGLGGLMDEWARPRIAR